MCAEYRIRDAVSRRNAVCVSESNNKNKRWIFLLDLLLYFCSILPPCNELWQSNPAWKAIEAESILDDSNRNSLSFRKRGKRKEKEGRTNRFYERSLTRIKMKRNLSEIVKKKKKRGTIPDVSRVANNSPIKNWFDERIAMALFDLSSSRSEWLAEKLRNFRETARRVGIGNGRFRWKLGRKSSFAADGRGKWSRVCINLEEKDLRASCAEMDGSRIYALDEKLSTFCFVEQNRTTIRLASFLSAKLLLWQSHLAADGGKLGFLLENCKIRS